MANFRLDSTLQRIDRNVMQTDIDGSVVLLHIDKGKYYSLNATSSDLWRWLALPVVVQQLITKFIKNTIAVKNRRYKIHYHFYKCYMILN